MTLAWMRLARFARDKDAGGAGAGAGGGAGAAAAPAGGLAGAAKAAVDAAAPSGQGQVPAQGEQPKPQAPGSQAYWPDGLGEKFRGASDRETIDRLYQDLQGRPKPPDKPDGYQLTLPKSLEGVINPAEDKVLPIYRQIAHELGMSQDQFQGSVVKLYEKMAEAGMIDKPVDIDAEFAAISSGKGDRKAQIAEGARLVAEAADALQGLAKRGQLSEKSAAALVGQMATADDYRALSELLALLPQEKGLATGGRGAGAGLTKSDVESRMKDPRYDALSDKFDQAFYDETREAFRRLAGG